MFFCFVRLVQQLFDADHKSITCYDDDGSLNANCDRVLRHYAPYVDHEHPDDVYVSTTSVAMLFWADIDYWCARA